MIPVIETDRYRLRAPGEDDFPVYERFYADADASAFYGGPMIAHHAWRRLAMDCGHWMLRGYGIWVVERISDGAMIGGCGFWWPSGWPRRELTWWLVPEGRGKGAATETSRAAIRFGYDTMGWDSVETHMLDENTAARDLVVRLGGAVFARETFPDGRERDVFRFPRAD